MIGGSSRKGLIHPYSGVSENVVYPIEPNGFADHYPVFKWLAIIGNINPTFSVTNPFVLIQIIETSKNVAGGHVLLAVGWAGRWAGCMDVARSLGPFQVHLFQSRWCPSGHGTQHHHRESVPGLGCLAARHLENMGCFWRFLEPFAIANHQKYIEIASGELT